MNDVLLTPIRLNELELLIQNSVERAMKACDPKQINTHEPQSFIKGIHGLAKFLGISPARAQKLKNEGVFPFWQDGRTLLFDPEKVKEVMLKKGEE